MLPRLLACLALSWAGPALSQSNYALLVGVSEFDHPVQNLTSLQGPRNDIPLVAHTLSELWDGGDITVLANGLEQSDYAWETPVDGRPTRAAILAEFDRLAQDVSPGDRVLIYLTGHGDQAPSSDSGEPDRMDEIFLPADFSLLRSNGQVAIANHIRDDEIGHAIETITQKGAFVWLVVDACHAGTMERSATPDLVPRLAGLGLAQNQIVDLNRAEGPKDTEAPIKVQAPPAGSYVGFFASSSDAIALTALLPRDGDPTPRQHGVLTWALVEALLEKRFETYEDLAGEIAATYWELGNIPSAPVFAGNLGAPAMVAPGTERRWAVTTRNRALFLQGGQIDGITQGSVVTIRQGKDPVLTAEVAASGLEEARLDIVEVNPRFGALLRRDGLTDSQAHRWLWLEDRAPALSGEIMSRPVVFTLRVSRPEHAEGSLASAQSHLVDALILGLASLPIQDQPIALEVVDSDQPAHIRLAVENRRLWFVPDLGALVTRGARAPFSLPVHGLDIAKIAETLRQIGKARNLLRVFRSFEGTEVAQAVQAELFVESRHAEPATGGCVAHPPDEPLRIPSAATPVAPGLNGEIQPVRVTHCDRVYLRLTNAGDTSLDLSPFYFGPHAAIWYLRAYHDARFFGLRLRPGETRIVSYTENTAASESAPTPVGDVTLAVIAVPSGNTDYAFDFRHLEGRQPSGDAARDAGAPQPLRDLLNQAGFGAGPVRTAFGGAEAGRAGTLIIQMETFAPEEHP